MKLGNLFHQGYNLWWAGIFMWHIISSFSAKVWDILMKFWTKTIFVSYTYPLRSHVIKEAPSMNKVRNRNYLLCCSLKFQDMPGFHTFGLELMLYVHMINMLQTVYFPTFELCSSRVSISICNWIQSAWPLEINIRKNNQHPKLATFSKDSIKKSTKARVSVVACGIRNPWCM